MIMDCKDAEIRFYRSHKINKPYTLLLKIHTIPLTEQGRPIK